MMKYILLLILLFHLGSFANQNFLIEHNKKMLQTFEDIQKQSQNQKKLHDKIWKWYIDNIKALWPKVEINNKHIFIKYTNNFTQKIFIDFRNGILKLSVISKNEKEAAEVITKLFDDLMKYDIKTLYKSDIIFNQIAINQKKPLVQNTNDILLVGDLYTKMEQENIIKQLLQEKFLIKKFKENTIYSVRLKLPKKYIKKREALYRSLVQEYNPNTYLNKILYALLKIHSGYNLYSKDNHQGYGLLNIELNPMAIKWYHKSHGYYELIDRASLYDFKMNIDIASFYLDTIYNKTLDGITNIKNKKLLSGFLFKHDIQILYKLFKVKNKKDFIEKINLLSSDSLYKKLMKKLPNKEMRYYIFRLRQEMSKYEK